MTPTTNRTTEGLCSSGGDCSSEDYISQIEEYIFPTPYEWLLISLHIIVFVVGLVGNALVCISVYRNHSMRTVTNYFIVNLAVADFLVILFCLPPSVLWDVTETWFFGRFLCKLVLYLQPVVRMLHNAPPACVAGFAPAISAHGADEGFRKERRAPSKAVNEKVSDANTSVSVSVSVLTLTSISIDRWYAICHPLKFKSTATRAKRAIVLIWLTSLLLVLPDAIVLDTRPSPDLLIQTTYFTDCTYTWGDDDSRIYQLMIVLFLYIVPFALMSVFYYQIARVLWNKNIPGTSESSQQQFRTAVVKKAGRNGAIRIVTTAPYEGQIGSRRKAAKMLIAVVVMFGLCYLPVHLINTLRYSIGLPQTHVTTVASLISHWLCYANSAVNPIIYNFMNGKFRKEFKNTFTCKCLRPRYQRSTKTPKNYLWKFTNSVTQCDNVRVESVKRK